MATSNSTNQESDIVNEVLTTTKHDHVDNFKQFEEIVLKDISVLDLENFDDPSSWIITVEDIFQTLKYKERTFVSLEEDSHQQQETELQKQRQEQIQSVVSAIPYFERIGAEAWFSNLLRKFGELDLEPDLIMYYVKEKFIGMPLIWYYENLSKFEDFSSFVMSFRLKYIDPPSIVQNATKSSLTNIIEQKPDNTTTISKHL
ncbi:unnamed protein product [Didymodactylos carnosus]|uniref:Uncharacterized protein n=1 Tax=Didymodactylos carnosus TaxID=1234261 RepID=A0A8S2XYM7_9BILA|nr:unnamed protein product [Didymodactylos carnosus]